MRSLLGAGVVKDEMRSVVLEITCHLGRAGVVKLLLAGSDASLPLRGGNNTSCLRFKSAVKAGHVDGLRALL